ncbi:MAG TPA: hypothetical protein VF960_11890 [Chloroflexota bacterium]
MQTPTVRTVRPTDFVPLIAFLRNGSHREVTASAWPEIAGEASARVLRVVLRQIMVPPGGYPGAWVCVAENGVHGLAVAKARAGKLAWDVKNLFVIDGEQHVGVELLEQLSGEAVKHGARRVFLATGDDTAASGLARHAGFVHYTSEVLYGARLPAAVAANGLRAARPRLRQDTQALFQLYNSAVPYKVRLSEAATVEEWNALERANRPWAPRLGGSIQHFVWDEPGAIAGWLQITYGAKSQHISLLVGPSHADAAYDMLQYGLSQASHKAPIFVPVRDYQPEVASALVRSGFSPVSEYLVFAREMTARVPNRAFVPARA